MATTSATQPTAITKNVSLRIDGQEVTVRDGHHDPRRPPPSSGSRSRSSATTTATTPSASAACAWSTSARGSTPRPASAPAKRGWRSPPPATRLDRHRATLTELLLADQPDPAKDPKETTTADNELLVLVRQYGVEKDEEQLPQGEGRGIDDSNPVIAVNHDACILCDRCVRACDDIQGNDVIGRSGKGYATRIAFDLNDPMGESSCVTCGECVAACPTGALDQQAAARRPHPAAQRAAPGRHRLPVLRRGLRAHLPRRRGTPGGRVCRGPRAARLQGPAVRQGPLRLGLRPLAAAPHHAADPPRGLLSQGPAVRGREGRRPRPAQARRPGRLRRGHAPLPRGELGGGDGPDRQPPGRHPRRVRAGRDRRLRVGQVLKRRGLPVPEADPRRALAPTTSTTAPGCVTPRASRRCSRASARRRSPPPTATSSTPTSRSLPAPTPPPTIRSPRRSSSRPADAAPS